MTRNIPLKTRAPRRTLIRTTRHYALFRLAGDPPRPREDAHAPIADEPSDEAIWAVLEHIPLRGRQLELVLDLLSRMPAR